MRLAPLLLPCALLISSSTAHDDQGPVWHNWHKTVECRPKALFYPTSVGEVQEIVRQAPHVRAAGLGHSFNDFVCSDETMISTIKMNQVLSLNTTSRTVTMQAGVSTRNLIEWLGDRGWTLPTYPYFIDQTIAGAVATGTHGSSTKYGSLSALVRCMKLVTADGSVRDLTPADGDVWLASKVSVGLLGVLVELTMDVVPDVVVERKTALLAPADILNDIAKAAQDPLAFDAVQYYFDPDAQTALRISVVPSNDMIAVPRANRGTLLSNIYYNTIQGTPLEPAFWVAPMTALRSKRPRVVNDWILTNVWGLTAYPGHFHLSEALPVQPKVQTEALQRAGYGQYDQYEFSVALDKAHDCAAAFLDLILHDPVYLTNFRVPMSFRFNLPEDWSLGMCKDTYHMYMNIDNYHPYRLDEKENSPSFERVKALMRSPVCNARVHWGKAGIHSNTGGAWTEKCVDYARSTFADTGSYDKFMQVAEMMDPTGKFADGALRQVPGRRRRA